jgi:cholecystokinin A receptor/hypocretin (orexin) receptor 2
MVAIAVDRYLCICHPFLRLLNKNRARVVIGLLTVFACVLGVLSCISYSVYKERDSLSSEYSNCTNGVHEFANVHEISASSGFEYTGQCDYPGTIVSMEYLNTWQKIYSSFYLISLIIVLLLYVMIYHSVTRRRSNRRKQKALNNINLKTSLKEPPRQNNHSPSSSYTVLAVDENNETAKEPVHLQVEMRENGVSSRPVERSANETSPLQQQPPRGENTQHHHHHRDHDTIANIKTALMLFIVAVVFIIAFFPAWLIALNAVPPNNIIFYMYFAYNVTNPIIYAFMNPTFRSDVKKICH